MTRCAFAPNESCSCQPDEGVKCEFATKAVAQLEAELVAMRELLPPVDSQVDGHSAPVTWRERFAKAIDTLVARSDRIAQLEAELASVKGHAEAMHKSVSSYLNEEDGDTWEVLQHHLDAYRAAHPKDAP